MVLRFKLFQVEITLSATRHTVSAQEYRRLSKAIRMIFQISLTTAYPNRRDTTRSGRLRLTVAPFRESAGLVEDSRRAKAALSQASRLRVAPQAEPGYSELPTCTSETQLRRLTRPSCHLSPRPPVEDGRAQHRGPTAAATQQVGGWAGWGVAGTQRPPREKSPPAAELGRP